MPFQHLAQPGDLLFVVVGGRLYIGALVAPVGADPQFGLFVHGVGTDLHLQHLALRTDHRSVQGTVAVLLRVGDIVVELAGNVPPQGMHDTQRGVAVTHLGHQHPHRAHVVYLAELQALALHLPPDGIDVLGPAADVGLDTGGGEFVAQLLHDIGDVLLAIQPPLVQQGRDLLVLLGLQVTEGQVLQLPLDMTDAQAVGQGCIDVGHLASHPVAAFFGGVLDRTDGAGALGQLDQGHAHVVDHGHQHAPQVVDLGLAAQHHGLARIETLADRRHAQHAFDQLGHHRPEMLRGRLQGRLALAHRPVDDGRDQAVLIQLEIGQDLGHLQPSMETGGALRPGVLDLAGILLRRAGEAAGIQQGLAIEIRIHALDVIQPGVKVDAAIDVDWLMRSDLYHLPLPHGGAFAGLARIGWRAVVTRASRPLRTTPWLPHGRSAGTCRECPLLSCDSPVGPTLPRPAPGWPDCRRHRPVARYPGR